MTLDEALEQRFGPSLSGGIRDTIARFHAHAGTAFGWLGEARAKRWETSLAASAVCSVTDGHAWAGVLARFPDGRYRGIGRCERCGVGTIIDR